MDQWFPARVPLEQALENSRRGDAASAKVK